MASIKQWSPTQWQSLAAGPALVALFSKLGYDSKVTAMINAYNADVTSNLNMMKDALGNTEMTIDINYIWNSDGKMTLMMEPPTRNMAGYFIGSQTGYSQ